MQSGGAAARSRVVGEYAHRTGELVSGLVKRVDRNGIFVDLGGNAEGFIPREDMAAEGYGAFIEQVEDI